MSHPSFQTTEKYLLIADLKHLRVLRFQEQGDDPAVKPHLHELQKNAFSEPLKTIGEVTTDQQGKFGRGYGAGDGEAMSKGEKHNLESEMEKRTVESLADCIHDVLKEASHPEWILAAPQESLKAIEDALHSDCRKKLIKSVGSDLNKVPVAKLEERFL